MLTLTIILLAACSFTHAEKAQFHVTFVPLMAAKNVQLDVGTYGDVDAVSDAAVQITGLTATLPPCAGACLTTLVDLDMRDLRSLTCSKGLLRSCNYSWALDDSMATTSSFRCISQALSLTMCFLFFTVITAHTHANADEFLYSLKGSVGVGLGML
jgi:hypothetical protein